jgi:hypothetical protein
MEKNIDAIDELQVMANHLKKAAQENYALAVA